jgi:hypothetical protein
LKTNFGAEEFPNFKENFIGLNTPRHIVDAVKFKLPERRCSNNKRFMTLTFESTVVKVQLILLAE